MAASLFNSTAGSNSTSGSSSSPKAALLWLEKHERKQTKEAMREANGNNTTTTTAATTDQTPKSGRRACLCSPSTHPGSFRCRYHKTSSAPALAPQKPKPFASFLQNGGLLPTKPRFDSAPSFHCGSGGKQRQLSRFGRAAIAPATTASGTSND